MREFALVLGLSFLVLAVPTALAVLTSHVLSDERVEVPASERPTLQLRGEPGG